METNGELKIGKPTGNIMDRAVALSVSVHAIGNHKKVSADRVNIGVEADWLSVSKQFLDADAYQAIKQLDGELSRWLKTRCLPSLFKNGVYLLPVELIGQVDERLESYQAKRKALVKVFIA